MTMERMDKVVARTQNTHPERTREQNRAERRGWKNTFYDGEVLYGTDTLGNIIQIPKKDQRVLSDMTERSGLLRRQKYEQMRGAIHLVKNA